jgi:hypothetical protein
MSELDSVIGKWFDAPTKTAGGPAIGELRRAGFVSEVRSVDAAARTITFTASTESIDRYQDCIRVAGWKLDRFRQNPVFLFQHKSNEPPIGKVVRIGTEQSPKPALVASVQFAEESVYPFAETIHKLYLGGFMSAVSVGFQPLEAPTPLRDADGTTTGGYEFKSQELLELSAVAVPANTDALKRAVDQKIILAADAERIFTAPKASEAAVSPLRVAYALGRLSESAGHLVASLREYNAARGSEIATVEDLERFIGHAGDVNSVAELEKLLRLS